eukprot:TRINITY_DN52869_c0_g1_i1.p1 TRINITY_DN52869_c0_g1~~TRINITY_DN52869_c0_g1_i1.p1  ORF type:complete len:312 (-),score=29.88 TRINITY_DN52869_c0_g1_i1:798-1733(-)
MASNNYSAAQWLAIVGCIILIGIKLLPERTELETQDHDNSTLQLPGQSTKTHIITFSFDDGYNASAYKIANLFERFNISAQFNIIASANFERFHSPDEYIKHSLMGDYRDWNALQARGHRIMPHSWNHQDLVQQEKKSPSEAKQSILKTLLKFNADLKGFVATKSLFVFPDSGCSQKLMRFAFKYVDAVQCSWGAQHHCIHTMYHDHVASAIAQCVTPNVSDPEPVFRAAVSKFLTTPTNDVAWLLLSMRGVDGEGLGPVSLQFLRELLTELTAMPAVQILPTMDVMHRYGLSVLQLKQIFQKKQPQKPAS